MPEVVVVDLHLRVGEWSECHQSLSGRGCTATKIVLTNHASSAVRRAAAAAGADHLYDKTSEFSMAVAQIGTLARRRRNGP
jgi:DNA-binding NarL/FixJ family response regulator